jgi:phosphatidate phosphatase APP1
MESVYRGVLDRIIDIGQDHQIVELQAILPDLPDKTFLILSIRPIIVD